MIEDWLTILRNVLIPHARQVGMAVHILPGKVSRQRSGREVGVGEGMDDVVKGRRVGDGMILAVHGEDIRVREGDEEERKGKSRGDHDGSRY